MLLSGLIRNNFPVREGNLLCFKDCCRAYCQIVDFSALLLPLSQTQRDVSPIFMSSCCAALHRDVESACERSYVFMNNLQLLRMSEYVKVELSRCIEAKVCYT